ncbi:hypothetical protein BV898_16716 [Hypsibius exemplaris]|uniref:Uncharacterized protein n=1 Tax=Hypsibius exemplaris TaxID=2072580 RepID=A0A9X6NFV8_HYPEX|nr:hypothetical protein BV898_16716 [Hypsibius exemplaris]
MALMRMAIILMVFTSLWETSSGCGLLNLATCPNSAADMITTLGNSYRASFCCSSPSWPTPYCCDWRHIAVNTVGLDPLALAIPVDAIIGLTIGGLLLLILVPIGCCCFCRR